MPEPIRVVCVGGGTGMPVVLRGLRPHTSPKPGEPLLQLTAIVTMADDGGSSGRLRRELDLLPPGDVRNCLVALAGPRNQGLKELFQFRFERGAGLEGHTVGNLVLGALSQLRGDFLEAVRVAGTLLGARGRVLPSTLRRVQLVADLHDGRRIVGEQAITHAGGRIDRLALDPPSPPPAPGVLTAIELADVVVLGPGSLYSSILPNLLVGGVAEALARSRALKVLVLNLMTQPGETDGYEAADHVRALHEHVGPVLNCVLAHAGEHTPEQIARYAREGAQPVGVDGDKLEALGVHLVQADVTARGARVRHDARKLANWILRLAELKRAIAARRAPGGKE
ncbi:MAG: YvcK family protein [Deltaproteobacteria bacterium]|nr:YvcK family protein [Deltaproteobacteria bacterium]